MFVDTVTIYVKGGDGGDGCMSFRREFKVPKGGPNGGDGGHGGNIVIEAGHNVDSLAALVGQKHWRAERGATAEVQGVAALAVHLVVLEADERQRADVHLAAAPVGLPDRQDGVEILSGLRAGDVLVQP